MEHLSLPPVRSNEIGGKDENAHHLLMVLNLNRTQGVIVKRGISAWCMAY
jgi:hypothetical protein